MQPGLTALILTFNEEKHITRCIESLRGVVQQIVVIDSGSTDATRDLCQSLGAEVYRNPWTNYSTQFNWGLDNGKIRHEWCLRIDADEYLTDGLRESLSRVIGVGKVSEDVSGFTVARLMIFMGQAIRHGGCGSLPMLRIFRFGVGRCESRWMDEHIILTHGQSRHLSGELIDENFNNIGWWISKHNAYSSREAVDLLNLEYRFERQTPNANLGAEPRTARKRWIKERIYAKLPTGLRAFAYFLWRYVVLLGFLDGRAGLTFHVLQGLWYRSLVDLKVLEIKNRAARRGVPIEIVIEEEYGYRVHHRKE